MADLSWQANLSYKAKGLGHQDYLNYRVPVGYFGVKGGAKRIIYLETADDMSLVHEIEQARRLQNLTLGLEVTENLDWLFDMLEIAARDLPLSFEFFVNGQIGKTRAQAFHLVCQDARIMQPQETSWKDVDGKRYLPIKLNIPVTRLIHGAYEDSQFVEEDW